MDCNYVLEGLCRCSRSFVVVVVARLLIFIINADRLLFWQMMGAWWFFLFFFWWLIGWLVMRNIYKNKQTNFVRAQCYSLGGAVEDVAEGGLGGQEGALGSGCGLRHK